MSDWTDDHQVLTNDATKARAAVARAAGRSDLVGGISREQVVRDAIAVCERRLSGLYRDLERLERRAEAQLPLDDWRAS